MQPCFSGLLGLGGMTMISVNNKENSYLLLRNSPLSYLKALTKHKTHIGGQAPFFLSPLDGARAAKDLRNTVVVNGWWRTTTNYILRRAAGHRVQSTAAVVA